MLEKKSNLSKCKQITEISTSALIHEIKVLIVLPIYSNIYLFGRRNYSNKCPRTFSVYTHMPNKVKVNKDGVSG